MSYADSRDQAQLDLLHAATQSFIMRWKANPAPSGRRTLFLFPGGEVSRLYRAKTPYVEGGPQIQHFDFDLNWLTLDSYLGSELELAMAMQPDGSYRDTDNRIIVAHGSVSLLCVDPYAGFRDWCDSNHIDRFTFGWDWRRPIEDAADFFRHRFLPEFRKTVEQKCGADPLADYALLGHSFGGMLVNKLARCTDLPGVCTNAITVAGLFYGYGGQLHRWFEGDNHFPLSPVMDVIRTVTSLSGCYALPFLAKSTYDAVQGQIDAGKFPIGAYPSLAPDATTVVDPYNPPSNHYPNDTGFDPAALARGAATAQALAAPLAVPPPMPLTCIRGIVTDAAGNPVATTPGGLTWATLPSPPYTPAETPLVDDPPVPGDGTLPAWTTALAGVPTYDIAAPDLEHLLMLDYPATQAVLAGLLLPTGATAVLRPGGPAARQVPPLAPRHELDALLGRLRDTSLASASLRRVAAQETIANIPLTQLNALAGRALADLLKPPKPRPRVTEG